MANALRPGPKLEDGTSKCSEMLWVFFCVCVSCRSHCLGKLRMQDSQQAAWAETLVLARVDDQCSLGAPNLISELKHTRQTCNAANKSLRFSMLSSPQASRSHALDQRGSRATGRQRCRPCAVRVSAAETGLRCCVYGFSSHVSAWKLQGLGKLPEA